MVQQPSACVCTWRTLTAAVTFGAPFGTINDTIGTLYQIRTCRTLQQTPPGTGALDGQSGLTQLGVWGVWGG